MTGAGLISAITDGFGGREKLGTRTFSEACLDAINNTIYRITAKPEFSGMQKTFTASVSTNNISAPVLDSSGRAIKLKWIKSFYIVDGDSTLYLRRLVIPDISSYNIQVEGRPTNYYLYGNNISFYPAPDTTYTMILKGIFRPGPITSTQTHILGDQFDRVIIAGSRAYLMEALQEFNDASYYENQFLRFLSEETIADNYKPDWDPSKQMKVYPDPLEVKINVD
jgi:hypothetical protein